MNPEQLAALLVVIAEQRILIEQLRLELAHHQSANGATDRPDPVETRP